MTARGTNLRRARSGATSLMVAAMALAIAGSPTLAHAQMATSAPSLSGGSLPVAFFKKKKKKKKKKARGLSPESAETKRQAIRDSVAADRESNKEAAAEGLAENAALLGDPVTMKEAGEVRLEIAREERSIEQAEACIEVTMVAVDIAAFYEAVDAGEATSTWLVIDPATASTLRSEAEAQIEEAEALIEEIEAEQAAAEEESVADASEPKKKKKKRDKAKPGTGMLIGGSVAAAIGAGGVGLAVVGLTRSQSAQSEVETLGGNPENQARIDELDEEGARANLLGWVGTGVAVAGLAIGVPLIIIGAKKRKAAGPSSNASVRVAPLVAGRVQGVALSGRF